MPQTRTAKGTRIVPANKRLARRLPATRGYVKKAIARNIENKSFPLSSGLQAMGYDSAYIVDLTTISQGDTDNARTANEVKASGLVFKGYITPDSGTAVGVARVMLVQWFEDSSSGAPALTDFFSATNISYIENVREGQLLGRGKVLFDRRFLIDDVVEGHHVFTAFISYKKLARKIIKYNNANTTGKNHIYLIGTSNIVAASSPPAIGYASTLTYKDA